MIVQSFRLLLVDRQEESFSRIKQLLSEIEIFASELDWQTRASEASEAIAAIASRPYDAYLVDGQLAIANSHQLLTKVFTCQTNAPVIWLVDCLDEGIAALKAGAADYLIRSQLTASVLEHSLRLTVEVARTKAQLKADETCDTCDTRDTCDRPNYSQNFDANLPQLILNELTDPVFITDVYGNFQFVSPHPELIFGYSCPEIQQLGNIEQIFGKQVFDPRQLETEKEVLNINCQILDKFGGDRHVLVTVKLLEHTLCTKNSENQSVLYSCHEVNRQQPEPAEGIKPAKKQRDGSSAKDLIPERQELPDLEFDLPECEERLGMIFDLVGVGLCHLSPGGEWLQVNRKFCQIVGYEPEQLLGKKWSEITDCQDFEVESQYWHQLLTGEINQFRLEKRYIRADGTVVWAQITTTLVCDLMNGYRQSVIQIVEDITERQETRTQIEALADRLLAVIETVGEGITLSDQLGNFIIFNQKMQEITGYSGSEANQCDDFLSLIYSEKEEENKARNHLYEVLQQGKTHNIETTIQAKDGSKKTLLVSTNLLQLGETPCFLSAYRDITERQQYQKELAKQKANLAEAQKIARLGSWELDVISQKLAWSSETFRIFGFDPQQPEPAYSTILELIHPDDIDRWQKLQQEAIAQQQSYEVELRIFRLDGSVRYLVAKGRPIVNSEGQTIELFGTFFDITEEKQAQMQLKESESRLNTMIGSISDGILLVDRSGIIRFANPAATKIFGRPLTELLDYNLGWPIVVGNTTELEIILPGGKLSFAEMTVAETEWQGEAVYVVSMRDIQGRRQAESALRESEARFRQLAENVGALFWLMDFHSAEILYVSPAYEKIWGRSCRSLYSDPNSWISAIVPEDREKVLGQIPKELAGESIGIEYRIVRPDGEIRWIDSRTFPIANQEGEIVRIAGIAEDISDRKLQDAQLQAYRDRLVELVEERTSQLKTEVSQRQQAESAIYFQARLLDLVNHAIITTDLSGTITYWNRFAETLYGWSDEEAVGRNILEIIPTEPTREQGPEIFRQLQQGENCPGEFLVQHKSGTCFPVMVSDAPIYNQAGELIGIVGCSYDISEQKQAETALKKANAFLGITVEERTKDLAGAIQRLQEEMIQRQEAEIALRDSEQRFRAMFEQSAVGMILTTSTGEWLQVNQKFCEFLGYSEPELLKLTWPEITYPEDLESSHDLVKQLFTRKIDSFTLEKRYLRKDGQIKWGHLTISYVRSPLGEPIYCLGVIEDISDRKLASAQLRDRLRLETAVAEVSRELATQQVADLYLVLQLLGTAVQANSAYLIIFESDISNLKEIYTWCDRQNQENQENIDKFYHIDRSLLPWWSQRLHANKNLVISHIETLPPEAEVEKSIFQALNIKSMLSVPIRSPAGQFWAEIGFMTVGQNVRNWSEKDGQLLRIVGEMLAGYWTNQCDRQKLRDSEALYAGIFQHSAESIFLLNIESSGRFIYETINPSYERIFNLTQSEVVGKSIGEIFPINLAKSFQYNFQKAIAIAQATTYEETVDFPDRPRILRTILLPIKDSSGIPVKLQGSSRDITEEKQFQTDLEQAKIAAEAANRAKSEFLANMSHELRTPLNAILGFTQLMRRDATRDPSQQEQLTIIHRSGEHLLSLINDILDLSKIELGRISLQLSSFDFYQMLTAFKEMLQVKADAKHLEFRIECSSEVPQYIETDEKKLRSTLINLIGNAIKFTERGSIVLRVSLADYILLSSVDNRAVTAETPQLKIHFEIEDTGPGIAISEVHTLFQPFIQTTTGQKSAEGTGLGLAISQRFVRLMGGEITVTSMVDAGCTFKFDIICTEGVQTNPVTPEVSRRAIALQPNQPTYRILVVEDQWTNLKLLVNLLEPVGFEVREATNGLEGIELWQRWQPHLIFMDLRMPVMDGYQAIHAIRTQEQQRRQHQTARSLSATEANPVDRTIVIALTASAFESNRSVVLDIGCDDFISKPFSENVLLETIAHYLGVQYIYENIYETNFDRSSLTYQSQFQAKSNSVQLTSDSLRVMPNDWIVQLHQTALAAREQRIYKLLEQIPEEERWLANSLTNLVRNLLFDRIVDLTQPYIRSHE